MPPVSSRTIIRSSPATRSRFRLEASASASNTTAGRRLANRSISLRSRNRPASGRMSKGTLSHFGPPTDPNSTASAALACASVTSVSGTPEASIAAPPTRPSLNSKLAMRRRSQNSASRNTSRMISGPMPSPASTRTLRFDGMFRLPSGAGGGHVPLPRLPGARLGLVSADRIHLLLGDADVIEAVQQAVLAERVEVEMHLLAVGAGNRLAVEIDRQHRVGALLGVLHQLVHDRLRQGDRQQAVLEAVVVENVGEAWRDDAAYAETEQGPGRMLAARAATEIVAGDDDLGVAVRRLVQHEIRVFGAVAVVAQLLEQKMAEAGALDRAQVDGRENLVGIDVDRRHRRRDPAQLRELFHVRPLKFDRHGRA